MFVICKLQSREIKGETFREREREMEKNEFLTMEPIMSLCSSNREVYFYRSEYILFLLCYFNTIFFFYMDFISP